MHLDTLRQPAPSAATIRKWLAGGDESLLHDLLASPSAIDAISPIARRAVFDHVFSDAPGARRARAALRASGTLSRLCANMQGDAILDAVGMKMALCCLAAGSAERSSFLDAAAWRVWRGDFAMWEKWKSDPDFVDAVTGTYRRPGGDIEDCSPRARFWLYERQASEPGSVPPDLIALVSARTRAFESTNQLEGYCLFGPGAALRPEDISDGRFSRRQHHAGPYNAIDRACSLDNPDLVRMMLDLAPEMRDEYPLLVDRGERSCGSGLGPCDSMLQRGATHCIKAFSEADPTWFFRSRRFAGYAHVHVHERFPLAVLFDPDSALCLDRHGRSEYAVELAALLRAAARRIPAPADIAARLDACLDVSRWQTDGRDSTEPVFATINRTLREFAEAAHLAPIDTPSWHHRQAMGSSRQVPRLR